MASNNLQDLNDMLFNQLVRLDNDNLNQEELKREQGRAKAMVNIGTVIVNNANTVLKAEQIYDQRVGTDLKMPRMIGIEHDAEDKK